VTFVHVVQDTLEAEPEGDRPAKRAKTVRCKGVLTCQATSTLAEVVSIMAVHNAHQVFVVDPDSKPLSAITIVDALRVIVDSVSKPDSHRGTPATPNHEAAVRTSGLLESATSCQSDRGVSACTSELSIPGVSLQTCPSELKPVESTHITTPIPDAAATAHPEQDKSCTTPTPDAPGGGTVDKGMSCPATALDAAGTGNAAQGKS
jgi:CBS domain-containing protein